MNAPNPQSAIIADVDEMLFRQVHPTQFPDGQISSEAFKPSVRDKDMLSTLREHVGPEEAYRRWTEDKGFKSVGTYAVTVEEVTNEELRAIDDAAEMGEPDHASIDFTQIDGKGKKKQAGRMLRDAAAARGCLHRPQ